jgi:hypothetical protein
MSTIPEALTAKALGMEVFAMSLITNLAAGTGINPETLSHSDVTSVAEVSGPALANFLLKFLGEVTLPPPTEIRSLYQTTPRIAPLPSVSENYLLFPSLCHSVLSFFPSSIASTFLLTLTFLLLLFFFFLFFFFSLTALSSPSNEGRSL